MNEKIKVLYAEERSDPASALKQMLEKDFKVHHEADGAKAWDAFQQGSFDVVITDICMPGMDGYGLTELIRTVDKKIPVIMCSSLITEQDIVQGFACGADEFVNKEMAPNLLVARMKAIVRKSGLHMGQPDVNPFFRLSALTTFNSSTKILRIGNTEMFLTSMEGRLLQLLSLKLNQCVEKEHLTEALWSGSGPDKNAYLDRYLVKIRKYLKQDPSIGIINTRGEGFCLSNQL